jgi:hypothetical protein
MRNRVGRGLVAFCLVLGVLAVGQPATARVSGSYPDKGCTYYANSNGFGGYCGGGYDGGRARTWRERLGGRVFVPCRNYPVPEGIQLPAPPEGKTWYLRVHIVDYDLDQVYGGANTHLEREIVPLSPDELEQCRDLDYMDPFWNRFGSTYPAPVLLINPTYTPRVNVPAYFALAPASAAVFLDENLRPMIGFKGGCDDCLVRMRAIVGKLVIDPGDGQKPVTCDLGLEPLGSDGYDETQDPFHQTNPCKVVWKRSSANQPDGMYEVKISVFWDVAVWQTALSRWGDLGRYEVKAVQRLPVQEVQAIGG